MVYFPVCLYAMLCKIGLVFLVYKRIQVGARHSNRYKKDSLTTLFSNHLSLNGLASGLHGLYQHLLC